MGKFLKYVNSKNEEDKKKSSSITPSGDISAMQLNANKTDFFTVSPSDKKEEEEKKAVGSFGKYAMEKAIGLDTFQTDLASMGETLSSIYGGWQTQETMANTRASVEAMQKRIGAYQEYQKMFGGADISEIASGYNSILDDWDDRTRNYGQYKSKDEYDNAMKLAEEALNRRTSMPSANLEEHQAEIDRLEGFKSNEYFKELNEASKIRSAAKSASGRNGYVYDPKTSPIETRYNTAKANLDKFLLDEGYADTEALQKDIAEKSKYLNEAKWVQKGINLASVGDKTSENYDKDFDTKSKYVSTKKKTIFGTEDYGDYTHAYINDIDGSRNDAIAFTRDGNAGSYLQEVGYEYMTEQEKKTYNYYYNEFGKDKADEYLHTIKEDLGARKAYADFENYEGNTAKELLFSIRAGVDQFNTGMGNLFNGSDEYIPVNATQQMSGMIRDDLWDDGPNILGKSLGQIGYDVGTTTANMAPSILASAVTGLVSPTLAPVVGAGLMGGSASGNAYQQKLNEGWDKDQARVYSTAIGISEGALQYALGGIGKLGGKLTGKSVQAMATGIDNALARFITTMGIKGAGEGLEESLQEVIAPFIENLALGYTKNNWSDVDLQEVAYSGLLGALSAGLLESGGTAVNVFGENHMAKDVGATIRANEKASNMFDIASLTPQESDAYNLYTAYAKKGVNADNASDLQLGRLLVNSENASVESVTSKKSSPKEKVTAMSSLGQIENIKNETKLRERSKELSTETKDKTPLEEGVSIQGIKLGEDTKIVTDKGEMSLREVALPERQAQLVARAEQMPENEANLFISQYDGNTDVDKYNADFNLAVAYSKNAFPQDTILKNKGSLSEKQVAEIYKVTRTAVVQETQKAIDNITQKHSKGTYLKGTFDDSVIDYKSTTTDGSKVNWNSLTSRQRSAIKFAKMFSKATGVNIRFIQSEVKNGKRVGKNGSYDPNTNTIEIDVYAGIDGKYVTDAIIPTLSHEVTHWMKAKSPAIYERIKNDLVPFLAEKQGKTIDGLVAEEMERMKAMHPDMDVNPESAMDELVARACEDMLTNSNQAKSLLAKMTYEERNNFVGKIQKTLKNLIEWVDELLSYYKSETEEAKLLRQYRAELKKVSKMWDEMLVSSIEANQALQKEGTTGEKLAQKELANVGIQYDTESQSIAPTQFSERTWTESEYVQNREVAINAIVKALGVTKAEAERYVDNVNSIARAIADDRARLDYSPNADENASVLKSNKEYKWTVDMSTLCAKRLLFTGTFDAIQKRLPNTAFNSEDIVAIRSMMQERGYEVACGICYVESTRRELGTITADFIERYKLAQKTGKPITRVNSEGKVVELKKTKEQMETTTDKSTDRFYADKDYTPTLAELNTTDIDRVKVEHPLVYEAYLQYMNARGQAKPKLLETRAEYKGEILKHFNKSAVNARNKAGGLRVQSFSDFEVAHLIDMMQIVLDMSRVGLMSQAYTKVPAFADVFGETGMKINLSLIAKGTGLDADGNLIFDDVEGINHKEAFRLRDKYSKNVGTILVGKNDAHIIKAMADPRIDYIIPFHKSFWKESLYEALGLEGYADYTETQNEKPVDPSRKIHNFQPSEYWDFTKSGDENAQTYLAMCKEDGRIPKFPQFQGYPGYWKLLIDFKMYDNDGVGSPQEVVKPNFSMDDANSILNSYEGGHRNYPVAQDVVDDFVKQYESGMQYSDRDSSYMDAVNNGDMETAQKIVDEVAAESGYTTKVYHGTTGFGFTRVNLSKSDDGISFFATDSKDLAQTYSGVVGETSIKKGSRNSTENNQRYETLVTSFVDSVNEIARRDILKAEELPFEKYVRRVQKGKMSLEQLSHEMTKFTMGVVDEIENISPENDRQIWKRSTELESAIYGMSGKSGNYGLYANTDGFLEVEGNGSKWSSIPFDKISSKTTANTREIVKWAKDNGYTGVLFKNIIDIGYHGTEQKRPANVFAFLNPQKQVKSAEPVTYNAFGKVIPLSKRFDESKYDIRYSDREVIDIKLDTYETMKEHFGTTKNYDVAGYLLRDGKMLDFSGKHWGGGTSTSRQVDHRDIQEVLEDSDNGVTAMMSMISNGNIRLMPEVGGINLSKNPNGFQASVLRGYINHFRGEVIVDIDAYGGDTIQSFEYSRGTSADKVLNDLEGYFHRGEMPTRTKSELADFHMQYSDRNYSYEAIVAKPDMKLAVVDGNVPNSRADIVKMAKKNASEIGRFNTKDGSVSVFVDDIGKDVVLATKGLRHGLRRNDGTKSDVNRIVTLKAGEIIKNSIRINELTPKNQMADSSYVLIGAAKGLDGDLYIVQSVINQFSYELVSMDVLYAVNAKKESAVLEAPRLVAEPLSVTDSTISIAELLDYVNKYFPDILPESILRHYGYDARPEGELGEDVLFSDRMNESVYDKMGETKRLEKETARLKKDLGRLKERLSIEGKVTGGTAVLSKDTDMVARHIRKIADSTFDTDKLSAELKDFYTYVRESSLKGTWNDEAVFAKAYELAENVLTEAKPKTVPNDYAKFLLREIRSKRIRLSETQKQEAKNAFGKNWNRPFFGKVNITENGISLDSQWQEWSASYPDFFDAEVTEGDQITRLYEIYDDLKDVSEIVQEYDAEERTRWLAEEIINKCWTLPVRFTIADKYDAQIKQLNFEHRQAMKEMRDDLEDRQKEQRKVDKGRYKELVQKIRDRKDSEIAEAKKLGKERLDKYKEDAERKTVMQSILVATTSLNKKLITNSKESHIPEALKPVVINLINAIDFSSKQLLGMANSRKDYRGMPTQRDIAIEKTFSKAKAMADGKVSLKDAVREAQKMFEDAERVATDTTDGTVDMSLIALDVNLKDSIISLIAEIDTLEKELGSEFVLQKMNLEQLNVLRAMVYSINHWATNVDKALAVKHKEGISNLSMQTIDENDALGERKEYIAAIESMKNFFSWSNLLPVNAFKRLGNGAVKVFDSLRDAQDTLAFHEEEITQFTEELFKGKKIQDWRKEVKEFSLKLPNGKTKTVRMPVSYVMSLYCVAKQEDAQRHLFGLDENGKRYDGGGGGMTIKGFKEKFHVSKDTKNTILNEKLVKQITSVLTAEQRNVADKLQEFMNTTGSEWCDTVSMALYGIKKFGIKDYFPITVTPTTIKTLKPQDKRQSVHFFSILNYGFTKSRNPKANQSIEIGDVFEIFANHMSMMSIYSAYALPIYDMVRWYNFTSKNEYGEEIGVQNSLVTAFGDSATTYVSRLISDLNGQHESSRLGFISRIFKNTKVAMVGNSISVALLQPTAYLKAMVKIPTRYLLKSALYVKDFGASKGVKKAKQYCGIALWKSQGNFETDISQNMATKILHDETWRQKLIGWSLKGAEWMDERTWGVLWNACEFEVRETRKDLKVGSDEFYETVGKKLRDVIYETQVVDSPLTRSDLMRSPDTGAKMITMFASEITVAYNMVHEAIVDAKLDVQRNGKEGAWKRNGKNIAMALTAYTLTSAISQIVATAIQGFRSEDDEEFEDYLKMYFTNFLSDWALIGKIPYIKEALNYAQGYTSSRVDTLWLDSASKAIKYWAKTFEGTEGASKKATDNTLKSLSYLSGIAGYNLYRDLMATLDFTGILDTEDFKEMLDDIFN